MTYTEVGNVKGPKGETGDTGPQGLPGTDSVPADAAVAGYVSTGGTSDTKTAVTAKAAEVAAETSFAQLDREGQAALSAKQGRVRVLFEDAAEVVENWTNLSGVNANSVAVESNELKSSGGSAPNAAKIAFTPTADGFRASAIIKAGTSGNAFFGVAGANNAAPVASSTDAFMMGLRNTGTVPGYLYGTGLGGSGQVSISGAPTYSSGERFRVTVVVDATDVSITMVQLTTGAEYQQRILRSAFAAVGGIGNLIAYVDGTSHRIEPVVAIKAPTTFRTKSTGSHTVEPVAPWSYYIASSPDDDRWRVQLPANYDPRQPTPLVLLLHNSSGSALNLISDTRSAAFITALSTAGYIIASANAGGSAWGNDASRALYVKLYEYVRARHAVSAVVLVGASMGSQVALNLLPRREIPNIVAGLFVAGVASLTELFGANASTYAPDIRTAFGIAGDGSDFTTKTDGYRPEDRPGHEFRGVPLMFVHSSTDAVASNAEATALVDKIAPYAPGTVLQASSGIHMAEQQFTDAATYGLPFLQTYAPTPA